MGLDELDVNQTEEIALQLIYIVNEDEKPAAVIEYLNNWMEFPSFDFVQKLTEKITDLIRLGPCTAGPYPNHDVF